MVDHSEVDSGNESGSYTMEDEGSCCSNASCCPPQPTIKRTAPKVGRNDPCPCESGRKFKKCCGR